LAVYVPAGLAHGFQSLTDTTEVFYQITERYVTNTSCGVRWDDPAFAIDWPIRPPILSERDAGYGDFRKATNA
jgi:dTDP-4-dehydrorhamnose 3,5-epimerase